ncbi:RDD family protein [Mycetocola tolaasinivorans]|uniref:RDD family protein n=1 Tax=Mycetocola tolaasinivorans TaxID=76635 RepID=A0A3L7A6U1_9MICO|nr:RDD family protein [Mycetocola tolaasinivorans]RLP76029.1 RDD family protein [Mycetocola tolaasinivorans]
MTATFSPITASDRAENELITGEAVALEVRPTSFLLRAAGALIDGLVSVVFFFGCLFMIGVIETVLGLDSAIAQALITASMAVSLVVLPAVIETVTRGRSAGRFAVGARIVRNDGGAISFRHAITRSLTGVLELYFTLGGIAALVGLLNGRSRRLGDLLAGTYSQHERVPQIRRFVRPMPPELFGWAQIADVAKLPEPLARRITQFLAQADRFTPESRLRVATELAQEAGAYTSPIPPVHPETLLIGIAAIRRDRDSRALQARARRLDALAPALQSTPHDFPQR